MSRSPPLPRSLYIETTSRCNSACRTCPRGLFGGETGRDLTLEEFRSLCGSFSLERAVLHGIGEPLLNPQIFEMVSLLKGRGCHVLFNSNALLLDGRRRRGLLESGLDELRVSLDGATPQTYERVRGIPHFGRVVGNLRALIRERGARRTPKVSLWIMAMKENVHELPEWVRLAAEIGVDEVHLQRLVTFGRGLATRDQSLMDSEEAGKWIGEAEAAARELGLPFTASGLELPEESLRSRKVDRPWSSCRRPWTLSYITAAGDVLPCCIAPFVVRDLASLRMGNLFEEEFRRIWTGSKYREFRRRLLSDDPPESCAHCGTGWSL
jgi:MoaA/NifB/PqqE/SkfB family radical SAM enzyme